jgi:hypothetical protein
LVRLCFGNRDLVLDAKILPNMERNEFFIYNDFIKKSAKKMKKMLRLAFLKKPPKTTSRKMRGGFIKK